MAVSGDVIKSYLVSLSAETDMASFTKFDGALKQTEALVGNFVSGGIADFLKFEVVATGAFASVGFSILGYLEHLATADQKQRMLAMQNGMAIQQYRGMTDALNVMGISLEDLQRYGTKPMVDQFSTLIYDQERLNAMMPDYEQRMDQVMDVVYQFQRLELKLEYFGMMFADNLIKGLGLGDGDIVAWLQKLNDWIETKMPAWSQELSKEVLPVLKEFWVILGDLKTLAGDAALEFTNLVGVFSGDQSLEGSTFNFHKFAHAVETVALWMEVLLDKTIKVEQTLTRFAPVLIGGAGGAAVGGAAGAPIGAIGGGILGGMLGGPLGAAGGVVAGSALGTAFGGLLGGGVGAAGGAVVMGMEEHARNAHGAPGAKPTPTVAAMLNKNLAQTAMSEAQRVSKDTGIPANLIFGQWGFETKGFTNRGSRSLNNLAGIKYSDSDQFRSFHSIDDFATFYEKLIKGSRYVNQGVLAARTPDAFARSLRAGGYYSDVSAKDYAAGIARYGQPGIAVTVNVGPVNHADPDRIASAVKKGLTDAHQQQMAQSNGPFGE